MKDRVKFFGVVVFAVVFLAGCTATVSPISGMFYSHYKAPLLATDATSHSKVGRASATSILGFGSGDVSIQAAMEDGGISTIHHVDYESKQIFVVYSKFTLIVYGE